MKPSFHDPHQFVPSRSSPKSNTSLQLTRKPREEKRNEIRFRPPNLFRRIHIHTYIYTHISYVLIALSRGSDPLHVRRFRAERPRSKS